MPPTAHGRDVRAYHVFKGYDPVLGLESRPGLLTSMGALPEGVTSPAHPFIDGVSLSPLFEHALRGLLLKSDNFDDFTARLVVAGYDLAANDGAFPFHLPPPRRVRHADAEGGAPVAALWPSEGQLATLAWQPAHGEGVFAHATATAYEAGVYDALHVALRATDDFDSLVQRLELDGFVVGGPGGA